MLPKYKISEPLNYKNDVEYSREDPIRFWDDLGKAVYWDKEYDSVYSGNELKPDWFKGGLLNTCYNVLDRNVNESTKDRYALVCECPYLKQSNKITYSQLYEQVCKFSGVLVSLGVTKGDNVLIYMPTSIQACIAMLSCSRIGATHAVVYGGYNEFNLVDRLESCKPKVIILSNYGFSNNDLVPYTPNIIKSIEMLSNSSTSYRPNHIITFNRDDHFDKQFISAIPSVPNSLDWNQLVENAKPYYGYTPVESSHPLYLAYTSGTTGKPKGIVRDNGGHLVANLYYFRISCTTKNPIMFAHSNIGWVSGHCCLYNILGLRGTFIMFEGVTTLSNHEIEFWEIIERYGANYFLGTPSTIRTILKYDPEAKSILKHNLSTLESIWVGGEVSYEPGLNFIRNVVGKKIYNIMGQTEASIPLIISFGDEIKPNMIGKEPPFVKLAILSEEGQELSSNQPGELAIKLPLAPGFATTLYNDDEGFYNNYFSKFKGYYKTGDLAYKDDDGFYSILSRSDDVITVATFKIKSTSVENSILKHPKVIESSCIGIPDEINGEAPIAFIILKEEFKDNYDFNTLKNEINELIEEKNGLYARLKKLIIVNKLPKTKNGKSTKSLLKKIINVKGFEIPPTSEDTEILNDILTNYKKQMVY